MTALEYIAIVESELRRQIGPQEAAAIVEPRRPLFIGHCYGCLSADYPAAKTAERWRKLFPLIV
jgi:hypothetical protein